MKVRDVLKLLRRDGWEVVRQRGSHRQLRHPTKPGLVTVAGPGNIGPRPRNVAKHPATSEAKRMKFLIVIEKTRTGYSAYSPDLRGCVAAARTRPSVIRAMGRAVEMHLDALRAEGRRRPQPTSVAYVEVRRA